MVNEKKICWTLLTVLIGVMSSCQTSVKSGDVDIELLLSRMTLKEKLGQMTQLCGEYNSDEATKERVQLGEIGTFLSFDPMKINEFQRIAVEESRLGIPLIFARDVVHGYKTIFPIPLGMASSFNPELLEKCSRVAAEEATADGIRWTFAPMIDIARDPRWGRIAEGFGEDPVLTERLGVASMKGFQDDDLTQPTSLAACAKHYVGYGASEGGRDYNSTHISERLMREVYLRPFETLAKNGIATFMSSFNDNDGIPMSGSKIYLKDILRDEWKYDGLVVTDWNAVAELIDHRYAEDAKEAAQKAVNAGIDIEMLSTCVFENAEQLLKEKKISEEQINNAVRNVLHLKKKLGLFEHPYYDDNKKRPFYSKEYLKVAKEAAIQSIVLLKNENKVLPLSDKVKTVAVIGPFADAAHEQRGTWSMDGEDEHVRTPWKVLQEEYGDKYKFLYAPVLRSGRDEDCSDFNKAIALAKKSDVVLLFLGEESFLTGEAHCLANLELLGVQKDLLKVLSETGVPVVTVVAAGRPLPLEDEAGHSDALIYAWHLGTMGGDAMADVLFGKVNPSGKLPVTIPYHQGQIPIYYNHHSTGRPAPDSVKTLKDIDVAPMQTSMGNTSAYLDYGKNPLFPFGYGLSYTTFQYSPLSLSADIIDSGKDSLTVTCTVTNSGEYEGVEIVQLYIRDDYASVSRPVKELKDFCRVKLKPGEKQNVAFTIVPEMLEFWNADMKRVVEPGMFTIWIGGSSEHGQRGVFELK